MITCPLFSCNDGLCAVNGEVAQKNALFLLHWYVCYPALLFLLLQSVRHPASVFLHCYSYCCVCVLHCVVILTAVCCPALLFLLLYVVLRCYSYCCMLSCVVILTAVCCPALLFLLLWSVCCPARWMLFILVVSFVSESPPGGGQEDVS